MTIPRATSFLFLAVALLCGGPVRAGDDADSCHYVQIDELPLHYTGPLFEIFTTAKINGLTGPVMVDTGAEFSSLTRAGAERRKLWLKGTWQSAVGLAGSRSMSAVRLEQFSIGPTQNGSITMLASHEGGILPRMDAIVGAPQLLHTDMEFSLAEKKMRFFSDTGCGAGSFLAYWGGQIFEIPFKRQVRDSPNPRFTVEVNGQPMEAIIDTGATTSAIMGHAAKRLGLQLGAQHTERLSDTIGFGGGTVHRWGTLADLKVGAETVRNAEISVIESENFGDIDVILGHDFLRAHRVLFAMGQRKLYISYVGGHPFQSRRTLEPWLVQEAEAGNADAQMELSAIYRDGRSVERDQRQADMWLEKALAAGLWRANLAVGFAHVSAGHYDESIPYLRAGLAKLPAEMISALWIQLTLGDVLRAVQDSHGLAHPNGSAMLDHINLDRMFKAASENEPQARQRGCNASAFIVALKLVTDDSAEAGSLRTAWRPLCTTPQAPSKSNGETS